MYQPQVSLAGWKPCAASRLWSAGSTRTAVILAPGEFIPIAERGGLIQPLTKYVLNEAIRQCAEWDKEGST